MTQAMYDLEERTCKNIEDFLDYPEDEWNYSEVFEPTVDVDDDDDLASAGDNY